MRGAYIQCSARGGGTGPYSLRGILFSSKARLLLLPRAAARPSAPGSLPGSRSLGRLVVVGGHKRHLGDCGVVQLAAHVNLQLNARLGKGLVHIPAARGRGAGAAAPRKRGSSQRATVSGSDSE